MTSDGPAFPIRPFLSVPLAAPTVDEFIDQLLDWARGDAVARTGAGRVVGYLNAHTTNLAQRDAEYQSLVQRMDLVYADGMAVVKAARRRGHDLPERVNAGDFLPRFLWAATSRGLRVAMVGSRAATVEDCAMALGRQVAGLQLTLRHHGHFKDGGEEERLLIGRLTSDRPDVLLVGMGSPRQERWAFRVSSHAKIPVVWCVGALFEYFGGERARAPVWMREAGLEWLYRLALEPKRLAGRYLLGNAEFILRTRLAREEDQSNSSPSQKASQSI